MTLCQTGFSQAKPNGPLKKDTLAHNWHKGLLYVLMPVVRRIQKSETLQHLPHVDL